MVLKRMQIPVVMNLQTSELSLKIVKYSSQHFNNNVMDISKKTTDFDVEFERKETQYEERINAHLTEISELKIKIEEYQQRKIELQKEFEGKEIEYNEKINILSNQVLEKDQIIINNEVIIQERNIYSFEISKLKLNIENIEINNKQEISELNAKFEENDQKLKKEISQLQIQLQQDKEEYDKEGNASEQKLKFEISQLHLQLQRSKEEYEKKYNEFDLQLIKMKGIADRFEKDVETSSHESKNLKIQLKDCQMLIVKLQEQCDEYERKTTDLQIELEGKETLYKEKITVYLNEISELKIKIKEHQEKTSELQNEFDEKEIQYNEKINILSNQVLEKEKIIINNDQIIQERNIYLTKISELKLKNESNETHNKQDVTELNKKDEDNDLKLKTEISQLQTQLQINKGEYDKKTKESEQKLRKEISQLQMQLQQNKEEYEKKYNVLELKLSKMKGIADGFEKDAKTSSHESTNLRTQLKDCEIHILKLKDKCDEYLQRTSDLEIEFKGKETEYKEKIKELLNQVSEKEQIIINNAVFLQERNLYIKEISNLKLTIENEEVHNKQTVTELDMNNEDNINYKTQISQPQMQYKHNQEEDEKKYNELDLKFNKEISQLQKENSQLKKENSQLHIWLQANKEDYDKNYNELKLQLSKMEINTNGFEEEEDTNKQESTNLSIKFEDYGTLVPHQAKNSGLQKEYEDKETQYYCEIPQSDLKSQRSIIMLIKNIFKNLPISSIDSQSMNHVQDIVMWTEIMEKQFDNIVIENGVGIGDQLTTNDDFKGEYICKTRINTLHDTTKQLFEGNQIHHYDITDHLSTFYNQLHHLLHFSILKLAYLFQSSNKTVSKVSCANDDKWYSYILMWLLLPLFGIIAWYLMSESQNDCSLSFHKNYEALWSNKHGPTPF